MHSHIPRRIVHCAEKPGADFVTVLPACIDWSLFLTAVLSFKSNCAGPQPDQKCFSDQRYQHKYPDAFTAKGR